MNIPFLIARRYFFSRKKGGGFNLITLISGISLLGYIVGAAALIIVLSVFNGFEILFNSMYSNFDADLQITARQGKVFHLDSLPLPAIRKLDGIAVVSEVLEENVLLRYDNRQTLAKVKGVDAQFTRLTQLDSCITGGVVLLEHDSQNFAMVGQGIAWKLAIDPNDMFQPLIVYIPKRGETDMLDPEGAFNKAAIFPTGVFTVHQEVDEKYTLVPLRFLLPLLERDRERSSIEIKLMEGANSNTIKKQLAELCGESYIIKNRFEQRDAFYKIMRSEKLISYIILFFILLVAASNTIASLYLLMLEKKKDLKILDSIGMTVLQARRLFVYESFFIALTGGGIGILLGTVLTWSQQHFGMIRLTEGTAFLYQAYPVELRSVDVGIVFVTVLFLGWLTALYPAKKAAQLFHG